MKYWTFAEVICFYRVAFQFSLAFVTEKTYLAISVTWMVVRQYKPQKYVPAFWKTPSLPLEISYSYWKKERVIIFIPKH